MGLGDRMKDNYENRQRFYLTRRTPVIVRVDGRAFHTFTKNFKRPFDQKLSDAMVDAAFHLIDEMQGCKLAYVQSDEASFVLTDYDSLETQGWFDYNKSKIESLSAALMSVHFNNALGMGTKAVFDARAFNIPESEVVNYFLWRAQDWHRNSVTMYAQAFFSHSQLQGKSIADMHEMLHGIGRNWANCEEWEKNGTFLTRECMYSIDPNYSFIDAIWSNL
jgi:tRNA(His) 5'-end guanylyltransferase